MTKAERRKAIVKRIAAAKIRETWRRKRAERGDIEPPQDDSAGRPEGDDELDVLPKDLVG
jgi:hypothetical protein